MKNRLILIFVIIFSLPSFALSGMGMMGSITKKKPGGEVVKVVYYGDLMRSPDRAMENARVKARGQYLVPDSTDGLELRTASPISKLTETSVELMIDGDVKTFQITEETTFCHFDGKRIERELILTGNMVTISSGLDEKVATYIRKGPIYFTGVMAGAPKIVDIACKK